MTTLVTGATGKVGRHVVGQLLSEGRRVRALTRDPAKADLPAAVEVVAGDLTAPETLAPALEGASAMHLIAFGDERYTPLGNAPEVVERAARAGVQRITVLTGTDDELAVARAVEESGVEWAHLRPAEFMSNALFWEPSIRAEGVVREAIGRELRFVELTEEQGREQLLAAGFTDDVVQAVIDYGRNPPPEAYTVLPTVEQVTGRPARTFADWAAKHADAFG